MFLGADKYKHLDNSVIKKCSSCGDTNLRFLGLYDNVPGFPVWICGNGHTVYPYYSEIYQWYIYVIYEGGIPGFLIYSEFGVANTPGGVGDYACCDLPTTGLSLNVYNRLPGEWTGELLDNNSTFTSETIGQCLIPPQLKITISGVKGVYGSRVAQKHARRKCPECSKEISNSIPTDCNTYGDEGLESWHLHCCEAEIGGNCWCNELQYNWNPNIPPDGGWEPCNCDQDAVDAWDANWEPCVTDESGVITNWDQCKHWGDCYWGTCINKCTSTPYHTYKGSAYDSAIAQFWIPLDYGYSPGLNQTDCSSPPNTVRCQESWPACSMVDGACVVTNGYNDEGGQAGPRDSGCNVCYEAISLVPCHECGTLRCSDQNAKYRIDCSMPDKHFQYKLPGFEGLANAETFLDDLCSLPHNHQTEFTVCGNTTISFPVEALKDARTVVDTPCSRRLEHATSPITVELEAFYIAMNTEVNQPMCLRRASRDGNGAVNTDDIHNQTIILDRTLPIRNDIMWTESNEKGKDNDPVQPFIHQNTYATGSDIEPELIAIINSESGTGGQIAFQTWPVSYDTDEFIDIEHPNPSAPNDCRSKRRLKAYGYGVMYPFLDDPIWKTENAHSSSSNLSGGTAYNFPVFLPGKNYKVGDTIQFKFWQALDGQLEGYVVPTGYMREVVAASAVITEVNDAGGILWYEFVGDPIAGDCPCTRDKYCGGLSRFCYPENHPPTEDGVESWCGKGTVCDQLPDPSGCDLTETIFTGSDCYPISHPWEIGGQYGISSCSGIAEDGIPARLEGNCVIPAKAPKYYYAWLPEPDCFLSADQLFLEYLTIDGNLNGAPYGYDFNGEKWPGCSPLIKIWEDYHTGSYSVKTRYKDYMYYGLAPCRKSDSVIDANTLFVAYSGGDGSVILPDNYSGTPTRTLDDYCRVYGFYQQKQYDCGLNYQGEFIMRAQGGVGCEPVIGSIDISFNRKEVKTDITIAAPTVQDYLLPEYLPAPVQGKVETGFPYMHGSVDKWQLNSPNRNEPDPRNNCSINLKKYFEQDIIEYDCEEYCTPEFDESNFFTGWDCTADGYKEYSYTDVFGSGQTAHRNKFIDICGYPWEKNCKSNANEDFITPTPECTVDSSGNIDCSFLDGNGDLSNSPKDKCDPFCMLKNTSAIIAISGIYQNNACPNASYLITTNGQSFETNHLGSVQYTYKIPLIGETIGCSTYSFPLNGTPYFIVWVYGDKTVSFEAVQSRIEEYLQIWTDRYISIGRSDLLGWRALYSAEPDSYPVDDNLKMFYSKIFEIPEVGKIRVLFNVCNIIEHPGTNELGEGIIAQSVIDYFQGSQVASHRLGGRIKDISILNPGNGYAFEVEERAKPTGVKQIDGITLTVESDVLSKKRRGETWTLSSCEVNHIGSGYNIGDTIPVYFQDSDAARNGVNYDSIPTIQVTGVDENGTITGTEIMHSGSYYKWIKTGHHRAFPITVSINNYWEEPGGIIGIGRNAELHPIVDVAPSAFISGEWVSNTNYGRIVDVKIINSGIDYMPNGKYWAIESSFNGIGLEHLVDPCKYDMAALDAVPVLSGYNDPRRYGYRYVAPPAKMNGGNVIKWSDRANSLSTIMWTGICPIPLMNKTYEMALTEGVDLLYGACSSAECSAIEGSWDQYQSCINGDGGPECDDIWGHLICNRYTGFYGDAFNIINIEGGDGDVPYGFNAIYASTVLQTMSMFGANPKSGQENIIPGCNILRDPISDIYCGGQQSVVDGGRSNGDDDCNGNNEYTIVGSWGGNHVHRIYKMGGNNITMTVQAEYGIN